MGMQRHQVRLGTQVGAPTTVLSYPATPQPTKFYELQFGSGVSAKVRAMKNPNANVALYSMNGHQLFANYGMGAAVSGVAFSIDIPYPDAEQPARLESYSADPYPSTAGYYTVNDFNIHPRSVPRSNVFTFQIADASQPIVLQNQNVAADVQVIQAGPLNADIKLYLYSQPPNFAAHTMGAHLTAFNQMLGYDAHPQLDLTLQPGSINGCTPLSRVPVPNGLVRYDLKFLAELQAGIDLCDSVGLGADPAECVQGPGC
jgi:hypothetical protein